MLELEMLSPPQFEAVVAVLIARLGYQLTLKSGPGVRGPDIEAIAPTGETVLIEVKHYRQPIPRRLIDEFAGDIGRYRLQVPDAKGLFVASGPLSPAAVAGIAAHEELELWSADFVKTRLAEHPDILSALDKTLQAAELLSALTKPAELLVPERASSRYVTRLRAIEPGPTAWRPFEHWCTEILTEIFKPHLGPPDQQTRTDDDLDIMDAIFPIRPGAHVWSQVRSEFATRFVVGEFKNHSDPIGQKQVESIAQYLWDKAKRNFGILVSRTAPSAPAVAQRRRVWLQENKMIVFLTDQELIEMLQMREADDEPFAVIDAQLEEFLRTLSP